MSNSSLGKNNQILKRKDMKQKCMNLDKKIILKNPEKDLNQKYLFIFIYSKQGDDKSIRSVGEIDDPEESEIPNKILYKAVENKNDKKKS